MVEVTPGFTYPTERAKGNLPVVSFMTWPSKREWIMFSWTLICLMVGVIVGALTQGACR